MKEKKLMYMGLVLILCFVIWTVLIQIVDVRPVGLNGENIGFSALNCWFHNLTGVNMVIYHITDWLGIVPVLCCMIFGGIGLLQLIRMRSLFDVDTDIILLGVYYVIVIFCYILFEAIPINHRPILIDGISEASYPSSTTLLTLSVMPTVVYQTHCRIKNVIVRRIVTISALSFSLFMVIGRTVAGVHWLTDIVGSVLLGSGLYLLYRSGAIMLDRKRSK